MLTSLFRRSRRRPVTEQRPLLSDRRGVPVQVHSGSESEDGSDGYDNEDGSDNQPRESQTLLPIFSAARLDRIPVYHLQHSIRLLIVQKVETTLSWDQLRTPQISQFLVKPLQQEIRLDHYSSATLYALLANCLQFQKDGQLNPGTVGVSRTRALMCELLAMRLMRESSTRELIDALFYDFDPLQGLAGRVGSFGNPKAKAMARLSTVEIAIRAHAKRFLAHPLVVQQLEAVWAGTIVFHSIADSLHRANSGAQSQRYALYGSVDAQASQLPFRTVTYEEPIHRKGKAPADMEPVSRRSVTLYDPSDASLFKLSRLRVPRYRQFFSTVSYAVMIGLFLSVLIQRSLDISALELVFWFWSAGFMLDEVVGFSEQGFGLYIISVWNSFDIGILLLFIAYYVLRLYGIVMPDVEKRRMSSLAYDVLASTAVLLFPRLFSVLDHYRYFSQLLIAFRMMAVDLAAVLILIVISCSGFFVAFTLSFNDIDTPFNASSAAYALFQILMGYTPAAWEVWANYNILGKTILAIFLVICHFLIVTILITVLTNSFLAIVQNANEEHQFLFAVNTISMVKSDALFSYVPPMNIIGWFLSPFRFVIPFRQFVKFNRTIIKITHVPILFGIFIYERLILSRRAVDLTDLVEQRGRHPNRVPAFTMRSGEDVFSPGARLREPSVSQFHKDQALEEVFRRPWNGSNGNIPGETARKESFVRVKSNNIVHDWMRGVGQDGGASSPLEEPGSIVEQLESRRPALRRHKTAYATRGGRFNSITRSANSDPEEQHRPFAGFSYIHGDMEYPDAVPEVVTPETDGDGDDELNTNDDEEAPDQSLSENKNPDDSDKENQQRYPTTVSSSGRVRPPLIELEGSAIDNSNDDSDEQDPKTPVATKIRRSHPGEESYFPRHDEESPERPATQQRIPPPKRSKGQHVRTASSATILFAPLDEPAAASSSKSPRSSSPTKSRGVRGSGQASKRTSAGAATPDRIQLRKSVPGDISAATSRHYEHDGFGPLLPRRKNIKSAPNLASFLALDRRKPSFSAMALDLASDLGDNRIVPNADLLGTSLGTQLEMATSHRRTNRPLRNVAAFASEGIDEDEDEDDDDEQDSPPLVFGRSDDVRRLNRMMLERMTNLEESFREVLREVKGLSQSRGSRSVADDSETHRSSKQRPAQGKGPASKPA